MFYFHVTNGRNWELIKKNGLIPDIGPRSQVLSEDKGIFLFTSMSQAEDAVMNWLGDQFEDDEMLMLLEVEIPNDVEVQTSIVPYEVQIFNPIPKEYIKPLVYNF